MNSKRFRASLAAAALLASPLCIVAAPKESPSPASTEAAAPTRPLPFNGKVFSVDKEARTFSTENNQKKLRVFSITTETRITKEGKPAAFDDIKPDYEVRGSALKQGEGHFEVLTVSIGAKVPPKPSPTASPTATASPSKSPTKKKSS